MYTTYTTEAIVCGSKYHNTSDKSYLLFTRDAGMLFANARSVREERSKQRYALQDFAHIRVSLLKGKSGWKIGSVESMDNAYFSSQSREERGHVFFIFALLRRFLHGEEANTDIFDDVVSTLRFIRHTDEANTLKMRDIFALRFLNHLGYIAKKKEYEEFLVPRLSWENAGEVPAEAKVAIENALSASHL